MSVHTSTPHIHTHKEMDEATCPDALLMQLFPKLLYVRMMCVASRSQDVMYTVSSLQNLSILSASALQDILACSD